MESNVWFLFERAILGKQGLIRAKESLSNNIKNAEMKKNYKDLRNTKNLGFLLLRSSITKLKELPQDSIDYVITDPPYGHSIQYGELLYLWGAWLNLPDEYKTIFKDEIVVNSRQKKDLDDYEELLYQAFKKVYSVLKPGRYCTITFHNPSLTIRNVLYRSVIRAGFNFEQVIYQKPARASAKSLLQPIGSQSGDYFFRFKKPEKKIDSMYSPINEQELEKWIIQIVADIITTKGEPMPFNQIQNSLDPILYKKLYDAKLLMTFNPRSVKEIMKENIGKVFQFQDTSSDKISEKKNHYNLWTVIKEK
jgi:hypothetical protein